MSNKSMLSFSLDPHCPKDSTFKWSDEDSVCIRISPTALSLIMPIASKPTAPLTHETRTRLLSKCVEIAARCLLEGSAYVRDADGRFQSVSSKKEKKSSENGGCTKLTQLNLPF